MVVDSQKQSSVTEPNDPPHNVLSSFMYMYMFVEKMLKVESYCLSNGGF